MNYIKLLNAFLERASEDPDMTPSARTVYHALVHLNNKLGWKINFLAEYREVMHFASITSKNTYYKAVQYLHDRSYINYTKGRNEYSTASFELLAEYQKMGKQRESTWESEENQLGNMEGTNVGKQEESKENSVIDKLIKLNKLNKLIKPLNLTNNISGEIEKANSENLERDLKEKEKSSGKKENLPELPETIPKEPEVLVWPTFDDFWNEYDKKIDPKNCLKKWVKLNQTDREKVMQHLPGYKASTPDKKYRKNPETYLNKQSWENEIIQPNATKSNTTADKNASRQELDQIADRILQSGSVNG